jgi:hypothetical protein
MLNVWGEIPNAHHHHLHQQRRCNETVVYQELKGGDNMRNFQFVKKNNTTIGVVAIVKAANGFLRDG